MKEKILILSNSPKGDTLCEAYRKMRIEASVFGGVFDLKAVEELKPDFVVSYGYSQKVPKETIAALGKNIINTHPSLLPINRGMFPNFWSFIYETRKGVTVHCMDAGLDTGEILLQEEFFFDPEKETFRTTYDVIEARSIELLTDHIEDLVFHKIEPRAQVGKASFHNLAKFERFKKEIPFSWDENIGEFLAKNKSAIASFLEKEKFI